MCFTIRYHDIIEVTIRMSWFNIEYLFIVMSTLFILFWIRKNKMWRYSVCFRSRLSRTHCNKRNLHSKLYKTLEFIRLWLIFLPRYYVQDALSLFNTAKDAFLTICNICHLVYRNFAQTKFLLFSFLMVKNGVNGAIFHL